MNAPLARSFVVVACICLAAPRVSWSQQQSAEAVSPRDKMLRPFNGKDLTGWTTWLTSTARQDPNNVYSVVGNALRISGEGMGYLATVNSYKDYHLSLEYKWGQRTDGSKYVRNSGILLHAVGSDGNARGVWMTSIECQLAQGCEGDLIVIRGQGQDGETIPATLTSNTILAKDGRTRWSKDGQKTVYSGKQFWWSQHEAGFAELLDTRGKDDVASLRDEWTRVECICDEDRITIRINGVTVNSCYHVFPSSGKILLENEGNEIYFRNLTLRPLNWDKASSG